MKILQTRADIPKTLDELMLWAIRLWPGSKYLQREWVRAVTVVRGTRGGWIIEHGVGNDYSRVGN